MQRGWSKLTEGVVQTFRDIADFRGPQGFQVDFRSCTNHPLDRKRGSSRIARAATRSRAVAAPEEARERERERNRAAACPQARAPRHSADQLATPGLLDARMQPASSSLTQDL